MRFVHTADWHLGRSLGGASFQPDQEHLLLGQFLAVLRETRPDAVLVAGDVFDRAVPPAGAVALLDDILAEIVHGLGIPLVMIPGNHDDPRRLAFGARIFRRSGLHLADSAMGEAILFEDSHGPVAVLASGYASPLLLAELFGGEAGIGCHDTAFGAIGARLRGLCPAGARSVLLAHAFVAGGTESPDSERVLQVGGARPVSTARFEGFHYVALGHLHREQAMAGGRIRYSGSPLAYSFEEAAHGKSVTLVEIDAAGAVRCEAVPLAPRRRLRTLEGTLQALLDGADRTLREDWFRVRLTDDTPVWDPMARLRQAYPHVLELDSTYGRRGATGMLPDAARARRAAADPLQVVAEFYADTRARGLPPQALPAARAAVEQAQMDQALAEQG